MTHLVPRLRSVLVLAISVLGSCAPVNGANEDLRLPVVHAILRNGVPAESLTVLWAGTPDYPYPPDGPSPHDVDLWITSTAADSVPVVPTAASGVYTIAVAPRSGVTYELHGTILGVSVHAATTVPMLAITSPRVGDTLSKSIVNPHHVGVIFLPIILAASGAAGYDVISTDVAEGQQAYLTSTIDQLTIVAQPTGSQRIHADIVAFDSNATAFYGVTQVLLIGAPDIGFSTTGSVSGALGLFGSSTSAPVDIVLVP